MEERICIIDVVPLVFLYVVISCKKNLIKINLEQVEAKDRFAIV